MNNMEKVKAITEITARVVIQPDSIVFDGVEKFKYRLLNPEDFTEFFDLCEVGSVRHNGDRIWWSKYVRIERDENGDAIPFEVHLTLKKDKNNGKIYANLPYGFWIDKLSAFDRFEEIQAQQRTEISQKTQEVAPVEEEDDLPF